MVAHGRPSRHVLSAGGSSTGPNGAWQCVAEEVHVHRRGFLGQDATAHVGLPSEPERLYGRWQEQRLRYHKKKHIDAPWNESEGMLRRTGLTRQSLMLPWTR